MALDMTSFDAALKEYYVDQRIHNLTYGKNPFLALVPKMENFGGRNLPVDLIYGNPQGRSATFATAQANKTDAKVEAFTLTRKKNYGLASIDNETMEASRSDKAAFLRAATVQIDGVLDSVANSLGVDCFGSGYGDRAQVNAEPTEAATTVITLKSAQDIVKFEVGMTVTIYSAQTSGTQRTTDGSDNEWAISAVDRDAGTITLSAAYDSSGTIAADDYIFVEGDEDNAISGLQAWLPNSAPGATAFFGVDRSVDVTRLGGIRYDGSSEPIEEALIGAAARCAREGGTPDTCFVSFNKWAQLEKSLGSKVSYADVSHDKAAVGFRSIMIHGPQGPIKVMADRNCPDSRAFMLQMNTWKLYSLGSAPRILKQDGLMLLRDSSADSAEVRVGYYAQLGCNAPGYNVNVNLG